MGGDARNQLAVGRGARRCAVRRCRRPQHPLPGLGSRRRTASPSPAWHGILGRNLARHRRAARRTGFPSHRHRHAALRLLRQGARRRLFARRPRQAHHRFRRRAKSPPLQHRCPFLCRRRRHRGGLHRAAAHRATHPVRRGARPRPHRGACPAAFAAVRPVAAAGISDRRHLHQSADGRHRPALLHPRRQPRHRRAHRFTRNR